MYNNKKSKNLALNIELLFFIVFFIFVSWAFHDLRSDFMSQTSLFSWLVFILLILDIIPFYSSDKISSGFLYFKIIYMALKGIIVLLGLFMSFYIISYHL